MTATRVLTYLEASIREILFKLYNKFQCLVNYSNSLIDSLITTAIEFGQETDVSLQEQQQQKQRTASSSSSEGGASSIDFGDLTSSSPETSKRGSLVTREDIEHGYVYLTDEQQQQQQQQQ